MDLEKISLDDYPRFQKLLDETAPENRPALKRELQAAVYCMEKYKVALAELAKS
jgi:hypothetical protein